MTNQHQAAKSPLRIGVVGLGAIGLEHVGIYRGTPDVVLTAVVDPRDEVRADVAEQTGATAYATLDELLAANAVDAISLCTPDHLHFADSKRIIESGLHLLLEKPITTDPAEADALTLLAENADVVVMPGQTLRFEPRYHHARQVVKAGGLGEVQHGYLRRDNKVSVGERAGGRVSVAFFLGIHDIDALQWITGEDVIEVQGFASAALERTGRQSMAVLGNLRLSGGGVVQVESSWNLPEDYPTDLDARFRLVGSQAALSIDSFDSGIHVAGDQFALPMPAGAPLYGSPQGALAVELQTFVRSCLTGAAVPVTVREAAKAVKVVAALEEAVTKGITVQVAAVASGSPVTA
ncbi:Gfo/Idh/MocA family oxidoreductase [Georgenia sp. EYE_87]|uniref:Gfo/Idh/MocA family protein n=1 Tax=Georgenia sp. EYE_87 TaxID=2853448 RepID=UPI002006516C|nr:Gfo/Idh/MocA family oxidoreductase [Georgenia sp. EYE_87]MCK6210552.1 Gfo/Idh/MocA family oxidoreductase [Georgenia sp. EYE_87]